MKAITFTWHEKSKRFHVPVEQKPLVSAYNRLSPENPDYFWEHMNSSPKKQYVIDVADRLMAVGYVVTIKK